MKLSEEIIISYSEKIYGYAYGKLRDPDKAGDLSQEIMLNLLKSSAKNTATDNPDGFVYTVCRYTFAGYLRKKYRQNKYEGICIDNAAFIPSDESVEKFGRAVNDEGTAYARNKQTRKNPQRYYSDVLF